MSSGSGMSNVGNRYVYESKDQVTGTGEHKTTIDAMKDHLKESTDAGERAQLQAAISDKERAAETDALRHADPRDQEGLTNKRMGHGARTDRELELDDKKTIEKMDERKAQKYGGKPQNA